MKHTVQILVAVLLLLTLNHQLSTLYAQSTVFTYQGRVVDNGTNFTGTGQFEFALVTSTNTSMQATATANAPSGGFITGYTLTGGGNGYASAPTVTITGGGGSGATATATVSGGMVTAINPGSAGSGYTSTPTVILSAAPTNIAYTTYWSNDGTSVNGGEPAVAVNVMVNSGLFTVVLGDATIAGMSVIPTTLFQQQNLQLRIWFNDGTHGFAALDPAQNLTPTPYATTASQLLGGFTVQNNSAGAPNVIGGSSVNFVSSGVIGATIGGGGAVNYSSFSETNNVTADFGTVSGGAQNTASGFGVTVGGGAQNTASVQFSTVGGGTGNNASGSAATVGGGIENTASGSAATVGGGSSNTAGNSYSTVGGGIVNTASGQYATVGGGYGNTASGQYATVGGGVNNIASGYIATVGGGDANNASGVCSFAAGYGAQAINNYSFVWNDGGSFFSTTTNQFAVHANGGVRLVGNVTTGDISLSENGYYHNLSMSGGNSSGFIYGSYPKFQDFITLGYNYYADANGTAHIPDTGGGTSRVSVGFGEVIIAVGGVNAQPVTTKIDVTTSAVTISGTFNNNSDRNAKQDFAAVSPAQMLERVTQLPISEWSYKEDPTTRHVGPMGQDFYATFNIGTDEKHIAPIDEGGVALAAIQGLNQKVDEKDAEIQELKARLEKLESLVNQKNGEAK
jgi:hypothetical protein